MSDTTTTTPTPRYIVQSASAQMPSSCRGTYRRVAVLELHPGYTYASMISERARAVARIVETWEARSVGTTDRCAYQRALAAARSLATRLNATV